MINAKPFEKLTASDTQAIIEKEQRAGIERVVALIRSDVYRDFMYSNLFLLDDMATKQRKLADWIESVLLKTNDRKES